MSRKEELQAELDEIERDEATHFDTIEKPKYQKYVGRCFKCVDSYSGDEEWYVYYKVLYIKNICKPDNKVFCEVDVLKYETDCFGESKISLHQDQYLDNLGEEIDESEFDAGLQGIIGNIYIA